MEHTTALTPHQPASEQAQGKVFLSTNIRKRTGTDMPDFTGNMSIPGTKLFFDASAWLFPYESKDMETGELKQRIGLSGSTAPSSRNAEVDEQLQQMLAANNPDGQTIEVNNITLRPGQFVVFENTFKDKAEARADGTTPNRPTHYLRWNPGNGQEIVAASLWQAKSKQSHDFGKPVFGGFTQYPQPGKETDMSADMGAAATAGRSRKKRSDTEASMDR